MACEENLYSSCCIIVLNAHFLRTYMYHDVRSMWQLASNNLQLKTHTEHNQVLKR